VNPSVQSARATPSPVAAERNREQTCERILAAVGEVLARDGFGAIGVNAIARQAGVDKVLIYRYFGGLNELLATWGRSGQFWPDLDELLADDPQAFLALPAAQRLSRFMGHFIDGLRARPLTLEILAAEVLERNELTAILEEQREAWGEKASRLLGAAELARQPELRGQILLLVLGVQQLLIRSRKVRIFSGIDVRSDAGWDELKAAIASLAARMFDPR